MINNNPCRQSDLKHLLFLNDIKHLKAIQINNNNLLKSFTPITGNMEVAFELEIMKLDFIDEWSFLGQKDIEENQNKAYVLSKNWWNEDLASTQCNGLILSTLVQQDLIYPFEAALNAQTIYSRLFNKYRIKKISGFFISAVPVIRTGPIPATKAVQSVSQAILFYMAEKRGIEFNHLQLPI